MDNLRQLIKNLTTTLLKGKPKMLLRKITQEPVILNQLNVAVEVREMVDINATFSQLYYSVSRELGELFLTKKEQEKFCSQFPDLLHPIHATFFLGKEGNTYHVNSVTRNFGKIETTKLNFGDTCVWSADKHRRIVTKLAKSPS